MVFWSLVQLLAEGEAKEAPPNLLLTFAPFLFIAVFFYLFILKPQRKEQSNRDSMLAALKKNDRVVTIGGIVGSVANISGDGQEVTLKVDDNTRIKFIRSAIQKVLTPEGEADKSAEAK